MDIHVLYAVNLATAEDVDGLIDQISDFAVDTGISDMIVSADGQVDPTFVAIGQQSAVINFTTSALVTALGLAGISGLKISSDVDDDGAEFWLQKVDEGGTRATGSNHIKITMNEGMFIPSAISAPQDSPATLEYQAISSYDGTNEPFVIAGSQALEGSPGVSEVFVAGKAMINGVQLEGVQDTSIDFGITPFIISADGQVWPTFVAIQDRRPTITIRTTEAVSLSTFGLDGTAQGGTPSIIYLRKVAEGGTRVADATAEHISFTVTEGMITVRSVGGTNGEPLETEVVITPTWDESNDIIAINTAVAIA